ncbi:MAG TPA: antibiotic biosynthesis monooxygenase family protein [Terriglobales bacterium]|jgi:hypothetical protein
MPEIVLINCFEVAAGREADFFSLWQQVNSYMRKKKGYRSHQLHRSLAPDARYRFINVARWASLEDFNAAHDEGFYRLVGRPEWAEFPPFPTLYEVVNEAQVEDNFTWRPLPINGTALGTGTGAVSN